MWKTYIFSWLLHFENVFGIFQLIKKYNYLKKKESPRSSLKNRWKKNNESLKNKKKRMNSGEYLQKRKENRNYGKKGYVIF